MIKAAKQKPDVSVRPFKGHKYPSRHKPGGYWATDEAWRIMDCLRPGAISNDARMFLAGLIAGALSKARVKEDKLRAAATLALHEMRHAVAPRNSFTDAVDALDAALSEP